jgi:hypothetical protein
MFNVKMMEQRAQVLADGYVVLSQLLARERMLTDDLTETSLRIGEQRRINAALGKEIGDLVQFPPGASDRAPPIPPSANVASVLEVDRLKTGPTAPPVTDAEELAPEDLPDDDLPALAPPPPPLSEAQKRAQEATAARRRAAAALEGPRISQEGDSGFVGAWGRPVDVRQIQQ